MSTCARLFAALLFAAPLAAFHVGTAAAQSADAAMSAAAEPFCDYCKDYTDAATSAGVVRSAYRPGAGYAAEPQDQAATARLQEIARLNLFKTPAREAE
jgi:hypothetical protein